MRIAMVGNFGLWNKGTMGARALPMARALVEAGREVCMIVPPWDEPRLSGIEERIDGVRVVNCRLPIHIPLLWHPLLTVSLLLRVLREPAEVLHIFKPKAYSGLVQLAAVWLRRLGLLRARIVLDTDDWEGDGGWNELETFPRPVKWMIAWHERWCLRHADAVTVASRELEKLVLDLGVPANRVFYVPNGVWDLNSRKPRVSNVIAPSPGDLLPIACEQVQTPTPVPQPPTVLLYTRFFEFKVERVVQILSVVLRRLPEAKLLVIGVGLWGEEETLARLVREAGMEDAVTFVGWVDSPEIPRWFRQADVAIYPMDDTLLNRAKCPMKLVDLMTRGIPVVADRVGQVAQYLEDGVSGTLVSSGDVEAFAQEVADLLCDAERRRSLRERARERALTVFDWRKLIDGVEKAYEAIPNP